MDVEGVAEWIQTVLPDKDLAERYADGLRDGFVDGDTMDTFPMGGDELTDHGIQKKHCRFILAKWAKLTAGEGASASADPPVPHRFLHTLLKVCSLGWSSTGTRLFGW